MVRRSERVGAILAILGLITIMFAVMPVSAANPNAKWFICKYVGTPGVNESLQTGQNPISVSENAIPISPVVAGAIFNDQQGRSLVLVEDIGQTEPDPSLNCPELPPPTPEPSPSASLSASPSASVPPSSSPSASASPSIPPPSEPPGGLEISVTTCPSAETASADFFAGLTALEIPEGESAIRFSVARAALLITLLTVRIDGVVLTLENTLGDGTVGDRIVSPGLHTWSVSNAADTEVLAEGEIFCPICNPSTPDVPDTALPTWQGMSFVAGLALTFLGLLLVFNARSVARRQRDG